MNIMLERFKDSCQRWHKQNAVHNYRGRANIFHYLGCRYETPAVIRHKTLIEKVLNNAEGICVII